MFCTECGKPLTRGATECANCHTAVEGAEIDGQQSEIGPASTKVQDSAPVTPVQDVVEPRPNVVTTPQDCISFGDWMVLEKAVVSSRGIIPLDQVSCCTYDSEPLNKRNIAIGAVIALAGLFAFTKDATAGIVLLGIGGVILYLALQAKRAFRLYSTSGYFFEGSTQEMDMGGNRIREFETFNAALVEYRHQYISELRT